MTFQETLDYLYGNLPMYQRIGSAAFKKNLSNTLKLCFRLGNPQEKFKSIHIAGTNGKGSSSHMIAAVLQCAGFKVGLYTSPHLKSFTERIRVNGKEIAESPVVSFVEQHRDFMDKIKPSFFEMTVALAFDHFAREEVDFAVVEVGLGGRLDSTNVITPEISLITNISFDHQAMLGNTLPEIAFEKAGIIKHNVPVVVGEHQKDVARVFKKKASKMAAPLFFASQEFNVELLERQLELLKVSVFRHHEPAYQLDLDLAGDYQIHNLPGVLKTLELLSERYRSIAKGSIEKGLSSVKKLTGLKGRWQVLQQRPLVICDTAHNESGIAFISRQLAMFPVKNIRIVFGMVNDKPVENILELLPKQAYYYFCEADIPRALDAVTLHQKAQLAGLTGEVETDVNRALQKAIVAAGIDDVVFVGGSSFVVAEVNGL
jgi:dihydrofolate synthase / folylpolyglutamate synthase